ncbi:MAG: SMEK domain-containing protein [Desulfuromonadaceae bacterium]|nr:SMEK domain-containing protein [Desulfuromonadaceae bacterium]
MSLPRLEKATHIADRLNELASVVKTRSRSSLTDGNRILETITARFFNSLFGWNLVNLNVEQANYQAVDLGDRHKRIAIQVTNEDSSDKISQTSIKANARKQKSEFDRLIIFFLLSKKPGYPKSFTPLPDCPEIETWDISDILKQVQELPDLTQLARAAQVLDEEMGKVTVQNVSSAFESQPVSKYHGKQRSDLMHYFLSDWLAKGPPVAILQGFPGSGKTQLTREIEERCGRHSFKVYPQPDAPDPTESPLEELAEKLQVAGIGDLVRELDKGTQGDLFRALLRVLRRDRILIVVDEFQGLFGDRNTLPPKKWQQLVEELNSSATPKGRLLLISNRTINIAPWCESCVSRRLDGLTDKEAADLLREQLDRDSLTAKFPLDRMTEIGHRLGGNPRALITLVKSLAYDSLEELISLAPDLFRLGDVTIDHSLVEQFERNLIERTLPRIDDDLTTLLRFLAVHRRPFTKEVYTGLENRIPTALLLRRQLIDRFLLDNSPAWDSLHPLAREVSVSRLRETVDDWHQAHSLAADYHFRHFKALQPKGVQRLTVSYIELRHHLLEAGRMAELGEADSKLTNYALALITPPVQSQIPRSVETLEERIALISAMPDDKRPKGLEYHLALCLKHRNVGGDYQRALYHARRSVWSGSYYAAWRLLIELEYNLNGIDAMVGVFQDALKHLGGENNLFSICLYCAQLLDKHERLPEAIQVLKQGINTTNVTCLSSLIRHCAIYMERAGRPDDAEKMLQNGINTPNMQELGELYLCYANLLTKLKRGAEIAPLLKQALRNKHVTKRQDLYLRVAEQYIAEDDDDNALLYIKDGLADGAVLFPSELYLRGAQLLAMRQQFSEARSMLEQGIQSRKVREPVKLVHFYVKVLEQSENPEDGVTFLKKAMSHPKLTREPSLYLCCAKSLAKAQKLDEAITILQRGILLSGMRGKNHFYKMQAEIMTWQGNLAGAIEILQRGIASDDPELLDFLYKYCAELLVKLDRLDEAIELLEKGFNHPALTNKGVMYQLWAKLLARSGRAAEGAAMLEKALRLPGTPGKIILYQTCADLKSSLGRNREAIELLKIGMNGPRMGNIASLIMRCAELLTVEGLQEAAIKVLEKGVADYPADRQLRERLEKITTAEMILVPTDMTKNETGDPTKREDR